MRKYVEPRRYLVNCSRRNLPHIFTDVLVIGSGAAGLRAAIEAATTCRVVVLTKDDQLAGSTHHAQGGIAVVVGSDDSFEEHINDTLTTGKGLSEPDVVRTIITEGPGRFRELLEWGAEFDRSAAGDLDFTLEGGHSRPRIVHARGDATGSEVQATLCAAVRKNPNIRIMEHAFAVDLVTDGNLCRGALVHSEDGGFLLVWARATILATGGCGMLFRETTNPAVVTGDGYAIAYRAGAELQDMEFIQFHPTTLYVAGASRALISESVRGEGGKLRNNLGERFMQNYHPDAELAPRDVVSRAIVTEMKRTNATNVLLDVTHMPPGAFAERFPTIYRICRDFDIDVTMSFIPVRPSAHYMVGGVKVDIQGRTSIDRLFAAGEVASTGLHGANRLASNSLLEALVIGRNAGRAAAELTASDAETLVPHAIIDDFRPGRPGTLIVADVINSLRALMWRHVGIERNSEDLAAAERTVDSWCSYVMDREFDTPEGWQLQDMLTLAKVIIVSARRRTETRGVHSRGDFPDICEQWQHHSSIRRKEGNHR